jgi:hypothetical protein
MASSFETQRFAMLLTMRAEAGAFHGEAETMLAILMVRRRDSAVSNHEAPDAAILRDAPLRDAPHDEGRSWRFS